MVLNQSVYAKKVKNNISKTLSGIKGKRIALLGTGNSLLGDDGIGPFLIGSLKGKTKFYLIDGGSVPENFVYEIIKNKPEVLILADAADLGKPAGTTQIVDEADISNVSFSSHQMPLSALIKYVKSELPELKTIFIGIQPKHKDFEKPLSKEAKAAVAQLAAILEKL